MYFRKKHPTGCLKQCLYITYGSTHVVSEKCTHYSFRIKTPATPSFITNTTDMTRFKIASATALYLSFQKNPIDSLNTVTALLIPFSKKLMHKTSTDLPFKTNTFSQMQIPQMDSTFQTDRLLLLHTSTAR